MAGHCLVEGLRALGAQRVAVVNGYYRPDWSAGINGYLEAAGFDIVWHGDLIDQGLVADHDEKLAIEAETLWDYPDHLMIEAAVVLRTGQTIDDAALSQFAAEQLPAYARPTRLSVLSAFPRTTSGKIDRKRLGDEASAERRGAAYGNLRRPKC